MLPASSVIKSHKLFTIHQDKIIRKFSVVKEDSFDKVADKIKDLIER